MSAEPENAAVEPATYPGTLFEYSAGAHCGVLVTENVMRKLAKLQQQHLEAVKRVLTDNVTEVFPSMWTLHFPDRKQTTVHFIDTSADVRDRIERATHSAQPLARFPVFIAGSMGEAAMMADARHGGAR